MGTTLGKLIEYMDSKTYPKASFNGQIDQFDWKNKKGSTISGILKIRDKTHQIQFPINFEAKKDTLYLKGEFTVNPKDFDIKIPSIVREKISEKTKICFQYALVKK